MPELPDVEIYKRYLEATSLHQRIRAARVTDEYMLRGISSEELQARTKGRTLESARRHGKYLFAGLDRRNNWLVFHFGMTGDLKYGTGGGHGRYARLILDFTNGYSLAYRSKRRLGEVRLVDDVDSFIHDRGLGPDALSMGRDAFGRLMHKSRGSIKPLLMNQNAIAGIGNIYADEMLFQGRIHPQSRAKRLDDEKTDELYRVMALVLNTAIRNNADAHRFPPSYLTVRRHAGAPCPRCGSHIRKKTISGRSAYYCPECQKLY